MRNVGEESRKTYQNKLDTGFFTKYMSGCGLDIGYSGYLDNVVPILESAVGVDTNYPGYDGKTLPFPDNSQDYVYSSHCLEHITDHRTVIKDWFRVVKPGGFIVTIVPHRDLYEKRLCPPSRWNPDHKGFYIPSVLLKEFEESMPINSFRVRHLRDNDEGHIYTDGPEIHGRWLYEIELVVQKL